MPLLGNLLFSFFTAVATWLAKYITQKMAVTIALVAVVTALFVALYAALRVALTAAFAGASNIHPMFGAGVAIVISPHTASLVSSYITFWSLAELYKWKVNIIQLWSRTI
jgi:hypothetical protein